MAGISFSKDVVPLVAMVTVEISLVGLTTIFKAATFQGMSYHAFIFYSYVVASLLLLPLALFFPTTALLPPFSFNIFCKICILAMIGVSGQLMGYAGVNYSSPTLASAIGNLSPAFTFILAVVFRSSVTWAKIIGTLLSISGAFVVVFYKGPTLIPSRSSPSHHQQYLQSSFMDLNWILGGLFLASERLFFSLWYITQTHIMKMYPAELLVVLLQNMCCTFISLPCLRRNGLERLEIRARSSIGCHCLLCEGVFGSIFCTVVHSWGLRIKGPVYISIFKPFSIVIAAFMTVTFLGDEPCLGSVIGAVIISVGFYAVIWRKAKKEMGDDGDGRLGSPSKQNTPLLKDYAAALA